MDSFSLIFLGALIGVVLFEVGRPIGRWGQNRQPVQSTEAQIIAKWIDQGDREVSHRWNYYCKFQTQSGDRPTFRISEVEYHQWQVGYRGILIYQGKQYYQFQTMQP